MRNIGATEIIIIALVIILLFGGKKLPELIKGIGQSIREFKKGSSGESDEPKDEPKKEEGE